MVVEVVNAMEWVRSRPRQFFGRDDPGAVHLLAYLMADVVDLGGGECVIRRSAGWWITGSDVDWLGAARHPVVELFRRVVPAPGHGEHSMRGEILVAAFAVDVAVTGEHGLIRVQGDPPVESVLQEARGLKRAILFRL